ncbi:MAG: acyl-CoA/acyl-ACP dehydrogenase, partial [Deltaproteobacteria bacterium]|nr:acyl-CoA/acyl-ACP dehydrogenase [Deltaproteobacteria bacterium]
MIDFSLTEEQLAIQRKARDFAEKEMKALGREVDRIADP